MMRSRFVACLLLGMGCSSSLAAQTTAEHLASIALPLDARVESVGSNLEQGGSTVSIATFEVPQPVEQTVDFYRERWAQGAPVEGQRSSNNTNQPDIPAMVENRVGPWLVLGHLQNGFQRVLQLNVEEPGNSRGFLSVMKLQSAARPVQPSLDLPGLQLLSTTRSRDAGKSSSLSVHAAELDVGALSRQLTALWQERGWTAVSDERQGNSRVLLFNRRQVQLDIVVSPAQGGGSLLIMNEVRLNES